MSNNELKYSKFKREKQNDLSIFSSLEEKIEYLVNELDFLKKIKSKTRKDIKLEKKIEYLEHRVFRLKKENSKPVKEINKEQQIKLIRKVKIVPKEEKNDLKKEDILYLKEEMEMGSPIIVKNPFEYIEAFSLYIESVDIHLNYNNIEYYIQELKEYFSDNNTSIIAQKYFIKFLADRLKKIKPKIPKEETTNREDLKKVIEYLEKYEYEKISISNVKIKYINPDILENELVKIKSFSKLQKTYDIYCEEELILILLEYLEFKFEKVDNNYIKNKHVSKVLDYINENLLRLDIEFFPIFELKLLNINKRILNNDSYINEKGLLGKSRVIVDDLILKLKSNSIIDNPITIHRMVKYIVNDLKDVEFLLALIRKIPDAIDDKVFNEILETYFNIILNSNDYLLIIYYQKVIETMFKYSKLTEKEIDIIINSRISSIRSRDSFVERIDKDYREALLNQTNMILNKAHGCYYNELLEPYMNTGYEEDEVNNEPIFTIDSKGTFIKENAFSIKTSTRKRNGLIEDVYYLTLYTSDISDYFKEKDFNQAIEQLISCSLPMSRKKYSLDEGEIRNTIAFTFTMDSEANIEDIKVTKQKIKVKKNFFYHTLKEDFEQMSRSLNDQIIRFYFLGTSIIKRQYGKMNKEYNSDYFANSKNYQNVFPQMIEAVTIECNKVINEFFMNKGLTLIDRQLIVNYLKQLKNTDKSLTQLTNFDDLLSDIELTFKSGIIYNASNINYELNRYSKVSSPLREPDCLINQLLAYHYSNCYVDKSEASMINFILDGICDELNSKHKVKQLTKSKKVVKLYQSDEEDTIV